MYFMINSKTIILFANAVTVGIIVNEMAMTIFLFFTESSQGWDSNQNETTFLSS